MDELVAGATTDEVDGWDVGHGRRVLVRRVAAGDAGALFDLFEQLDAPDRCRRLGSPRMPPVDFFEQLARPDRSRGEERMVAELVAVTGSRLVGEAGLRRLASGNADLTMVAAARWRGLTGPVLLDAVVDAAASAGVPNLEADVHVDNAPMLALLHDRGVAVVGHDGLDRIRLRVGTSDIVPTWQGGSGSARVLIEAPGGRSPDEAELTDAGLDVLTCFGPRRRRGCPAMDGRPCALAAAADVVVTVTPEGDEPWCELLRAHAALHPGVLLVRSSCSAGERSTGLRERLRALIDDDTR